MDTTTYLRLTEEWATLWQSGFRAVWEAYLRWWQMVDVAEMVRQEVGKTPSTEVWSQDRVKLYRYRPTTTNQYAIPVVCVPSLINRNYILDLLRGRSLVAYLVSQGLNVYMLDWGNPTLEDKTLTLDDHIAGYLPGAVAAALQQSGASQVILLGYCLGGTFAAIYANLFKEQVAGLVNLAGPINFHDNGIFSTLTRSEWFDADKLVDTFGNIPASFLCTTFQMLHPTSHLLRILKLMDRLEDLDYVQSYAAIQTWIFDQIDFPGAAFRQTIKDLYQGNQLINNQLIMAGQPIRLDSITCPVLTIASRQDETAPGDSVAVLNECVGSTDKQLLLLTGPHVGMVAGRKAPQNLWPHLAAWLVAHNFLRGGLGE